MEIRDFLKIAAKRWVLVSALSVLAALAAALVSYYVLKDVYEAKAVMIIGGRGSEAQQSQLTLNDYNLNLKLVDSYRVLLKTDRMLGEVIAETRLNLTTEELSNKIGVSSESDTDIIEIAVKDMDPSRAMQIANAVTAVFTREIPQIMRMDNVQVIDKATLPRKPVQPNRITIVALAFAGGFAVGLALAMLLEYLDVTIKSGEQLGKILGAPSLGSVPHLQEGTKP